MALTPTITITQTKIHYTIEDIYSCDTVCGIYLLECKMCGKQYVGETGTYFFMSQLPRQTRSQHPPCLANSQPLPTKNALVTPNNQPSPPGNDLTASENNATTPVNNPTTSGNNSTTQMSTNNHSSDQNDNSNPPIIITNMNDGDGSTLDQPVNNNPNPNPAIFLLAWPCVFDDPLLM